MPLKPDALTCPSKMPDASKSSAMDCLSGTHGAQLAVDATIVSRDGQPRAGAKSRPGVALAHAAQRKRRHTYPELGQARRCPVPGLAAHCRHIRHRCGPRARPHSECSRPSVTPPTREGATPAPSSHAPHVIMLPRKPSFSEAANLLFHLNFAANSGSARHAFTSSLLEQPLAGIADSEGDEASRPLYCAKWVGHCVKRTQEQSAILHCLTRRHIPNQTTSYKDLFCLAPILRVGKLAWEAARKHRVGPSGSQPRLYCGLA